VEIYLFQGGKAWAQRNYRTGDYVPIDFKKHAEAMGAHAVFAPTAAEITKAVHAISNGKTPSSGHADAVESLKIALAATRSLKEGRSVRLTEV
jgi:predicted dehydrogenase